MKGVTSENKLNVTPIHTKSDGTLNKNSISEKGGNRSNNTENENINNEHNTIHTDVMSYFNRAIYRIRNGDIEGARADFKMFEKLNRNLNSEFTDYPSF